MRQRLLRGWRLGQLAVGLGVAVALTAVLALAIAHGGAPGRPAGAPTAQSTVAPAASVPCQSIDATAAASPAAAPSPSASATSTSVCTVVPTDTPGPSPADSPAATSTPQPPTPAATPSPAASTTAWQPQHLPSTIGGLMGLTCVDATHCWAVGEDPTSFAPAIAATSDGGATWIAQRIPQRPASLQAVFDVACFSTRQCVAAAATSGGETTSVELTTTNGGATWTQRSLPSDGQNGPTRLACLAPSTCYLYGADVPRGVNVVDLSSDAGMTWTATTAPEGVCSLAQSCRLSGMTFLDAHDGLLIGNRCPDPGACTGVVATTSDGGATWHTVHTGDGYIGDIWCGTASSSGDCITIGASSLVSHDRGTTWTVRSAPEGLVSISCVDPLHCTAVGSQSRPSTGAGLIPQVAQLGTTRDGGQTWTTQLFAAGTSSWLNRVSCVSTSACWAAGSGGAPGGSRQGGGLVLRTSG